MLGAMSYSITVTTEGGVSTVATFGEVPDGKHYVSGHEDGSQRTLSVTRHDPEGRQVGNAASAHSREH